METPKIKLLIPIEIKEGGELPNDRQVVMVKTKRTFVSDDTFIKAWRYPGSSRFFSTELDEDEYIFPSHWFKEVETDLTIDELKKIGVIK